MIRQTKITGGRRMVLIFTREEGKLSAGTHISEKSKGGAALAIRPFAYGGYTVTEKQADLRSLTSAEALDAHFALGEDADRFAEASYVLEFTDKLLPDGVRAPKIFDLLKEYLAMLTVRKSDFRLLTISYMIKVMQEHGVFPDPDLIAEGELLKGLNDDILNVLAFITEQPLGRMDALTLEDEKERAVFGAVKSFAYDHLDLGTIKSERMLAQGKI
ncbi:MAG: DNA repair protein RecO [Clostridiales bacterium]|nr:DNA repair protein RecO [Clostridiales bacterium]